MSEWRESTWGDEISLEYGKGIRNYADANGPYRVYGSNGPVGWTSEPLAQGPGIILGRKGAYRGVRISKEPFFVIDTAYYVVPKSDLDIRWLYYAIIHHKLGEIDDGSPIPSTTRSAVYVRELSVPQKSEQQAIASILGSLDDKIELNRQMNETLEAMARALFKDWFVDFGPTRAKMEGRTPYLAPEIWSLFPDRLDDEGKPEGWKMQTLGEIFNVGIGRTPPRNEAVHFVPVGAGHTWLSIKNMGGLNVWARRSDENLARESVKRLNIPVVPENTVVVSFKLTVGRVAITSHSMCTNEAIAHLVRPKSSPYGPCYTYLYMVNYDYGQLGSTSSIATAVNSKSIKSIKFLNPGKICLNAFEEIASLIFSKIRANLDEVETLSATRDLLLSKLMSGEIRIKDAEKALEAVA